MEANAKELIRWLDEIDAFNSTPGEGTTRAVYTKEFFDARNYVIDEMRKIGLHVREDPIGNLFGEYEGSKPDAEPIWTGSHIDTVPHGGKYDGLAGVFAGLEAVKMLKEAGIKMRRTISVNVYAGEEMSRFGVCCIGSRAIVGRLSEEDLKKSISPDGESIFQVLSDWGFHPEMFGKHFPEKKKIHASIELHIEQNKILENHRIPVGIVTGICAPTNLTCTVKGVQSHAGGTSMMDRKDAFMAAAEIGLALERLARTSKSEYITGTIGDMKLSPGAINVVPGGAEFPIDIRSIHGEDKDVLVRDFEKEIEAIAKRRGVEVSLTLQNNDRPYLCSQRIQEMMHAAAEEKGIKAMDLISGPYHDSLMLGDITETAMMFIPCKDGISHNRAEAINIEDLVQGTNLMADVLRELADE